MSNQTALPSPFELFGLQPRFQLDETALANQHRDLSLALHPDRYAGRPASERRAALSRAIEINAAFRILRDPLQRAEAVLRARGVPVGEEQQGAVPPEFLFATMERREALSEAARGRNRTAIEQLMKQVRQEEEAVLQSLAHCLDASLQSEFSLQEAEEARLHLGKLRYFRRFFDEAEALLDELD